MKVKCDKCNVTFNLDDTLVGKEGLKVKCSKCSNVFKVYPAAFDEGRRLELKEAYQAGGSFKMRTIDGETDLVSHPHFRIVDENDCPFYKRGNIFIYSGKGLIHSKKTPTCFILVRDILKNAGKQKKAEDGNGGGIAASWLNCSGCTGRVMLKCLDESLVTTSLLHDSANIHNASVKNLLEGLEIFNAMDEATVSDFISCLMLEKFSVGEKIIKKGDPGDNLYITVSGRVDVVGEDGMTVAKLNSGDVFGEMSLLTGNPVGATIQVAESAVIIYISESDFKRILSNCQSLQMYFTRLLAQRMAEINIARSEEYSSSMSGSLTEMPPSELFQTIHMNQKTGGVTIKLSGSEAYLIFREGELIRAEYGSLKGVDAFFELLKLKKGRFKFKPGISPEDNDVPEIGNFMQLLLEGARKIDDADQTFLKTVIP